MKTNPDIRRYSAPAQLAHWLVFLLIAGAFSVGFYMTDLAMSPFKLQIYSWHKWTGVTIFILVVLRLLWRLRAPPPVLPASMPAWEVRASEISHRLLYLLMFAMPLSGWIMSSAKGFQTVWFGKIPLPDLVDKNPPLGEALVEVHATIGIMLLAVIGLHVAAALKHHFIDRDEVLARMTPGLKPRRKPEPAA